MLNRIVVISVSLLALSACKTNRITDFDFVKLPEFKEDAENVGDYPKANDAPQLPDDLRTAEDWDNAVLDAMALRDGFSVPETGPSYESSQQAYDEISTLKDKIKEYKIDDPIE